MQPKAWWASFACLLLVIIASQKLSAQVQPCNNNGHFGMYTIDLGDCEFTNVSINATQFYPYSGNYSFTWSPAPLSGQGSSTATYTLGAFSGSSPYTYNCQRLDITNNCMDYMRFDYWSSGQPTILSPAFPVVADTNLIYGYECFYDQYNNVSTPLSNFNWTAINGTIQSVIHNANPSTVDSIYVKWNASGNYYLHVNGDFTRTVLNYPNPIDCTLDRYFPNNPPLSSDQGTKSDLKLFPNPASDIAKLSWPEADFTELQMLEIGGKTLKKWPVEGLTSTEIGLGEFPAGLYFLRLVGPSGAISEKLVRSK